LLAIEPLSATVVEALSANDALGGAGWLGKRPRKKSKFNALPSLRWNRIPIPNAKKTTLLSRTAQRCVQHASQTARLATRVRESWEEPALVPGADCRTRANALREPKL
jgi:hypothetical protein